MATESHLSRLKEKDGGIDGGKINSFHDRRNTTQMTTSSQLAK